MVNSEQQGLPNGDKIEGAGENSKGQGQAPSTNMETIKVNYAKVIRKNQMLKDDYTSMVTFTLMYAIRERVLMDKASNCA